MPIHQARVIVSISLNELTLYTATFLSPHRVGRVSVQYSIARPVALIRDLIVLVSETPSVFVDFIWSRRYSNNLSHILSNLRMYRAFCAYIKERAESV